MNKEQTKGQAVNYQETKKHGSTLFPFNIYPCTIPRDFPSVALHWQKSMELIYIKKGRGIV
ncbi:MAG: AraC family transcriptional regulator, partial [Lachnospiraceae bacterium]|nr:AraC family transcriptional regulator [Lachnospiraceae bacterium]